MMTKFKTYLFVLLGAILATGIGMVLTRYVREIKAARAALDRLGSQVIETRCGPVEYIRAGEGDPVLVVHGTFGGVDQGLLAAQPLIDAGFQAIIVSRFGYLGTRMPEHASVDLQADAYACLLDALGIPQAALLTVSAGAVSSIRFAARYPERVSALVLISPATPGKVKVAPPPKAAFTIMRSDFLYWAMVTYLKPSMYRMIGVPASFTLTPATDAEASALLATTLPSSGRIDGFAFDCYNVDAEFAEQVSETSPYSVYHVQAPTLVINSVDDPIAVHANVRAMAEKFPNARLAVLPDGGHPNLGHSAQVNAETIPFLRKQLDVTAVP